MADSDKSVSFGINADPSSFVDGMAKAAESAKGAASKIQDSFKGLGNDIEGNLKKITNAFGQVQKAMLGITAVVAGGAMFKGLISQAADWNGEAGKMAKQLGITIDQASVLNVALKHLGLDSDVYTSAAAKMSKQIFSNAEAFETLGVKVRDTAIGAYRPITEVMGEVNQKLAAIHNPIEQNIAGMQVYGRSWQEIKGIIRLTQEQMDSAAVRAKELGLIVGPEGAAAAKQYKEQMRDLGLVSTSLSVQFGNVLLPIFTQTGRFLAQEGPAAGRIFGDVLKGIVVVGGFVWFTLKSIGDAIGALAATLVDIYSNNGKGIKAIGDASKEAIGKNIADFLKMKAMLGEPVPVGKSVANDEQDTQYRFKPDKEPREVKEKSAMGGWEAQLAEAKLQFQEQNNIAGTFYQFSKEQESQYWRDRLTQTQAGSADNLAVRRKVAEMQLSINADVYQAELAKLVSQEAAYKSNMTAKLAILDQEAALVKQRYGSDSKEYEAVQKQIVEVKRQSVEQLKQIDLARAQSARDAALDELTTHEQMVQLDRQVGVITQQELLTQQAAFETQKTAIQLEALNERLRIAELDPDKNIVETNRIHLEIEQAERQHQLRMGAIRNQASLETKQYGLDAMNTLGSGIQNVIAKALQGTMSLRGIMQGLWQAMTQAVTSALAKMSAEWVLTQLKLMIFGKVAAVSSVAEKAAEAGAGGVASMAAAPWPLNMSAPLFGAAMMASAMAYAPVAASAAGGYDIPSTINPLTQLHASEMVLPAKHADVIRGMADQGQDGGRSGDNFAVHIHATDAQSVARLFAANGDELVKVLQKQRRNFGF